MFSLAALLLVAARCNTTAPVSPEGPRAARRVEGVGVRRPAAPPITILDVDTAKVRSAASAPELMRTFPESDRRDEMLIIDVTTKQRIGPPVFDAFPAIVLNGRALMPTHIAGDQRLVALVPRGALRERNEVAVTWLGKESTHTSKAVILQLQ
jgi:hypothetical protein